MKSRIENKYHFKNCVGFIDGTHLVQVVDLKFMVRNTIPGRGSMLFLYYSLLMIINAFAMQEWVGLTVHITIDFG
jgi:hypothetical protein